MKLRTKLLDDPTTTFSEIQDILEELNLWEDFLIHHSLYTEDQKSDLSSFYDEDILQEVEYRGISYTTTETVWENPSITQAIWLKEQLEKAKDII